MARFALLFLLLYVTEKKRIPWLAIAAGGFIVMLMVTNRGEIRSTDRGDNPLSWFVSNARILGRTLGGGSSAMADGIEVTTQRIDYLSTLSYVVERTPDDIPYWKGETYENIFWEFVPRVVYSGKPAENIAKDFPSRYGVIGDSTLQTTSVTLPTLVEFYANYGPQLVVSGMFMLGLFFQVLYRAINYAGVREWALVSAALVGTGTLHMGSNATLIFGSIFLQIVVLSILGHFVRGRGAGRPSGNPLAPSPSTHSAVGSP